MRSARELMFADEDLEANKHRDPVAATTRFYAALDKAFTRKFKDGSPVHSFRTLLADLSTIVRTACEARVGKRLGTTLQMSTNEPNSAQTSVLEFLQWITV